MGMQPRKWRTVDYLRLGYDEEVVTNNPVVVFVAVEIGEVGKEEGERVVGEIWGS
jgi:hypothetical protein